MNKNTEDIIYRRHDKTKTRTMIACADTRAHVRACQCSQGLFSFNHCFTCVLKTLSSVNVLISDGSVFHSLVPIATKDDCPNVVLRFAVLQFPLFAPLVLILLFSLFINWQSTSGCSHT